MNTEPSHRRAHCCPRACRALLWALLALGLTGCAYHPYRVSGDACIISAPLPDGKDGFDWEATAGGQRPCADRWQVNVTAPVQFSMNFVEIDEQGMLVNRQQAESALAQARQAEADGAYVVVFVHGWHHNASSDDSNVNAFYQALAQVSRWNPTRKVKGIYIGWRGDSLPVPWLRYLTFWERKNTSDEVGRGGLLEFLLRLEINVRSSDEERAKGNSPSRLVVVGHSFGASVTFNALAHTYMQRFLEGVLNNKKEPRFRGYGDLVVLVNPAIEAMRYMPLQNALDYYTSPSPSGNKPLIDFSHEVRPALVILSSEGDWATRRFFPAARFFSTAWEAHNDVSATATSAEPHPYSSWVLDRDTVGNFERFQTHETLRLASPAAGTPAPLSNSIYERCSSLPADEMWKRLNEVKADGAVFPDSQVQVRRLAKSAAQVWSPYIVAPISTDIVRDHTHIGGPNLVCWINQLLDTLDFKAPPPLVASGTDPDH